MLLSKIKHDIAQSLKNRDSIRLDTLRFLLSAIRNAAIAKYGARGESGMTNQDIVDVIKKQAKARKESIEAFLKAGRSDLAQKEQKELDILLAFLPKELSDEELKKLLEPIVQRGEKNFGLLMKEAMAAVEGRADGGRVSAMIKHIMTTC